MQVDGFYMEKNHRRRTDLFSVEERIMAAWQTVEDLNLLVENFDQLDEEQRMNSLIGMVEISGMRMEHLFRIFEEAFHNNCKLMRIKNDELHSGGVPKHDLGS